MSRIRRNVLRTTICVMAALLLSVMSVTATPIGKDSEIEGVMVGPLSTASFELHNNSDANDDGSVDDGRIVFISTTVSIVGTDVTYQQSVCHAPDNGSDGDDGSNDGKDPGADGNDTDDGSSDDADDSDGNDGNNTDDDGTDPGDVNGTDKEPSISAYTTVQIISGPMNKYGSSHAMMAPADDASDDTNDDANGNATDPSGNETDPTDPVDPPTFEVTSMEMVLNIPVELRMKM